MPAPLPPEDLSSVFRDLLNLAITLGRAPLDGCELGPATMAVIASIARQHPEAPVELIAEAYDAFLRERDHRAGATPGE